MRSQIKTKVENFLPCQDLNQCPLEQKASMLPISHTGPLKTHFYLNSFCYTKLMCQNCICVSCNDVLISGSFWSILFNAHGSFPQTLVKKLLISFVVAFLLFLSLFLWLRLLGLLHITKNWTHWLYEMSKLFTQKSFLALFSSFWQQQGVKRKR